MTMGTLSNQWYYAKSVVGICTKTPNVLSNRWKMGIDQISLENYFNTEESRITRRQKVYETLKVMGKATSWEICNRLGYSNPNMARPRLTELKDA